MRTDKDYIRLLELMSVITEEWGEAVKEINNFLFKSNKKESINNAFNELNDIISPLRELTVRIEILKGDYNG